MAAELKKIYAQPGPALINAEITTLTSGSTSFLKYGASLKDQKTPARKPAF